MKKQIKHFFVLLMVITVMSTMLIPASAVEFHDSSYSAQDTRVSSPFPISMLVASTYQELTTMNNSAKRFTKGNITEDNVTSYGKIVHNLYDGQYSAGIGFLNSANQVEGAEKLFADCYTSRSFFNKTQLTAALVASRTYFLFVTNESSQSYSMHGTVSADVYN